MLNIARTPLGRIITGWLFTYMSFALPVKRLRETKNLLAFYNPQPSYPVHVLIVPKKAVASLTELDTTDQDFLIDLFQCVQDLVRELGLEETGYRLIVNGGQYQDVAQLHFHLISGQPRK